MTILTSQVLLVSSSKYVNKWIIPGGAIEEGEDPQSAAIREVEEEVFYYFPMFIK